MESKDFPLAGRRVDQLITNLAPGDGASDACLAFRSMLIDAGAESHIWAESLHPRRREFASRFDLLSLRDAKSDLVILHYTTGSDINRDILRSVCPLALYFHNITPSAFFVGVNDRLAGIAWRGRNELPPLVERALLIVCPSNYSSEDIRHGGSVNPVVIPIPVNAGDRAVVADQSIVNQYNGSESMILFVGRIAPNKNQHELLEVLQHLQRDFDPRTRLVLVGSDAASPDYRLKLERQIHMMGLKHVDIPGHVSPEARVAYYQCASVYLSLSTHEGFGIPLIEAMQAGIPVVARNATAIGETVGDGGLVIDSSDSVWISAVAAEVIENQSLRQAMIAAGHLRGEQFRPSRIAPRFIQAITPLLGIDRPLLPRFPVDIRESALR